MKKEISLLLCFALLLTASVAAFATNESFADVAEDSWYYEYVLASQELGLINGRGDGLFYPDDGITNAECIKLGCMVSGMEEVAVADSEPWYAPYLDFAAQNELLDDTQADAQWLALPAERAFLAAMLARGCQNAPPEEINDVPDGLISDCDENEYSAEIYLLYRAGVLTGDPDGLFRPQDGIKRSEAAAALCRLHYPEQRSCFKMEQEYVYMDSIPILMYHEVSDAQNTDLYLSPTDFEAHLQYFQENGYTPVTLDAVYEHWTNSSPLPEKPVVLTFDDGYRSMYETVYPILQEYGYTATFFVIPAAIWSDWHITEDMLREMSESGMEIGSHTFSHVELTDLSQQELIYELSQSKLVLEQYIGTEITSVCYPVGVYNSRVLDVAAQCGYSCAVTTIYGHAEESQGLLSLERIRIMRGDGAQMLEYRLQGLI